MKHIQLMHRLETKQVTRREIFSGHQVIRSCNSNSDGTITAVGNGYAVVSASLEKSNQKASIIVLVNSSATSYELGDVNMDGKVTAVDAMLTLKLALIDNPTVQ